MSRARYAVCEDRQRAEDGLPCAYLTWARLEAQEMANRYSLPYAIVKRNWRGKWRRVETVTPRRG